MDTLRFFHISDYHARQGEADSYRRNLVLGDSWLRNLEKVCEDGPIDAILFTGDCAFAGIADEYETVTQFLAETCGHLGLRLDRDVFPIPGNHDIDRTIRAELWAKIREIKVQPLELSKWMRGLCSLPGLEDAWRDQLLARRAAYDTWLAKNLGRPDLLPKNHGHGRLGYRVSLAEGRIHLIGLDSAWLCGDKADHGKIHLGEDQVLALTTVDGKPLSGLRIAMLHHPLADLSDGTRCQHLLSQHTDLLLRGHLHRGEHIEWLGPDQRLIQMAVGCLYESHEQDRWPNACQVLTLTLKEGACRGTSHYRAYSPERGFWHDDSSRYEAAEQGRFTWTVPLNEKQGRGLGFTPKEVATPPLFVGREKELKRMAGYLERGVSLSLVGSRRIGKSSLIQTFAERNQDNRTIRYIDGNQGCCRDMATLVTHIVGSPVTNEPDQAADALEQWAKANRKNKKPPLLCIDHFGHLALNYPLRFFQRLRGMKAHLVLFLATRVPLNLLYQRNKLTSPFSEMDIMHLGLFTPEAITTFLEKAESPLSGASREEMQAWAGGHPYYLGLLGQYLLEDTWEMALARFWDNAAIELAGPWEDLEDRDRAILLKTLDEPNTDKSILRSRGFLNSEGRPFGKVFSRFLEEQR